MAFINLFGHLKDGVNGVKSFCIVHERQSKYKIRHLNKISLEDVLSTIINHHQKSAEKN